MCILKRGSRCILSWYSPEQNLQSHQWGFEHRRGAKSSNHKMSRKLIFSVRTCQERLMEELSAKSIFLMRSLRRVALKFPRKLQALHLFSDI